LPVFDNFERAIKSIENIEENSSYKAGIEMLLKQFKDCLEKLGVKEIEAVGNKFDPNFHNAVLHIEDPDHGEGEIVEELQKGFLLREKVIRHSMVKVAN
jgi:molecular chaperone GrpE